MFSRLVQRCVHPEYNRFLHWHFNKFGYPPPKLSVVRDLLESAVARKLIATAYPPRVAHPVRFRPDTSDRQVFDQVFVNFEYDFPATTPSTIIDAGANIGLASVYFANRFPHSRIIALEPDANNFQLLLRNTKDYPQIECRQTGLWSHTTKLRVIDDTVEPWAYQFEESNDPNAIPAVGMDDLLMQFPSHQIDLLKMDIEGTERIIFRPDAKWLNNVKQIVVECHDWMIDGCTQIVLDAVDGKGFAQSVSGENLVLTRPG